MLLYALRILTAADFSGDLSKRNLSKVSGLHSGICRTYSCCGRNEITEFLKLLHAYSRELYIYKQKPQACYLYIKNLQIFYWTIPIYPMVYAKYLQLDEIKLVCLNGSILFF